MTKNQFNLEPEDEDEPLPLFPLPAVSLIPVEEILDSGDESVQELALLDPTAMRMSSRVLYGINLYLAGASVTAAARNASISPQHLNRTLKSPLGLEYCAQYYKEVNVWLKNLHVGAVKTIADSLTSPSEAFRLKAAELLLKHVSLNGEDGAKLKASATDVARQIIANLQININTKDSTKQIFEHPIDVSSQE